MSDEDPARQVHLLVRGRVQGVNFRWTLKCEAEAHGVHGWVRNRGDGAVEAVLQGPDGFLQKVLEWARRGPSGSWVSSVDARWEEIESPLTGFEIRL
jgi:acylphosphatase